MTKPVQIVHNDKASKYPWKIRQGHNQIVMTDTMFDLFRELIKSGNLFDLAAYATLEVYDD